jgi:16S rRNA (guanine966-N2)-methyltransferase
VTGGSARGRRLTAPRGIRPTSDLVRAAIFDALDAQGADRSRVLELYAGSGALGIEALSRGSAWCDFVEREAAGVSAIRANLEATGLSAGAKVHRMRAEQASERLEGGYTLVLADPPYADESADAALAAVAESALLAPGATLVLEHSSRRAAPEALGPLPLAWRRRYGDTEVSVYRQ